MTYQSSSFVRRCTPHIAQLHMVLAVNVIPIAIHLAGEERSHANSLNRTRIKHTQHTTCNNNKQQAPAPAPAPTFHIDQCHGQFPSPMQMDQAFPRLSTWMWHVWSTSHPIPSYPPLVSVHPRVCTQLLLPSPDLTYPAVRNENTVAV